MVVQAAIPIITAVGEFTTPYLLRKAGEIGLTRFIQVYGSAAATAIGIQKTQPVDLQTEKILGMPVSHITGQGEVYDDTDYSAIDEDREVEPLKYLPGIHGPKTKEQEEIEKIGQKETFPIQEWDKSYTDTGTKMPEEKKFEPPISPPVELPESKGFPDLSEEFNKPQIFTQEKTKDITKQTKDLVKEKPEFGALTEVEKQTALLEKGDKPDFYSRAIEAIKTTKDDKYTKGKWASILKSSTTKEELDYLGLTELLVGKESISKQELLKLVEGKDIAPGITVRSIPKDQMNPMWDDYSLGGAQEGTVEHIVFQIGKDKGEVGKLYKEPHFDIEYGTGTFAHSRLQVGYSPKLIPNVMEDAGDMEYNDWATEISEIFKNIQIVDEIQSQHLQQGRIEGFKSEWKILKGDEITKEFLEKNYPGEYKIEKAPEPTSSIFRILAEEINQNGNRTGVWTEIQKAFSHRYYVFNKEGLHLGQNFKADSFEEAEAEIAKRAVPDFPIKDSKKWVELVLNKMIQKAVIDGRDGIAITNGQIQANRYAESGATKEQQEGLKKGYDMFTYPQFKKIADKYGIKLEKINIENPEQAEMDQSETQMQFPRKVKTAQDNGYILKKITFQELFDRVQDTDIPGHAALYNNEGRGQGHDYIEEWFNTLIDNRTGGIPATLTTEEGLSGSGLKRWEKIRTNEVYVWKKGTNDIGEEGVISWDMPIVPVKDTLTNPAVNDMLNASSKDREYILKQFTIGGAAGYPYAGENINNIDLIKYTEYLRNYKPPEGIDLGYDKDAEQLIKMKFPKKLKKDFYGKRIKLTKKINQQTDRMFG